MRNNKGISIITLIFTIIIIIIISSIVFYYGFSKNVDKAVFTKIYTEMQEISTAVQKRNAENRINSSSYPYIGTELNEPIVINGIEYGKGYYKVTPQEMETGLGIKNASRDYIVNYSTGEVIAKEAIIMNERELFTLQELIEVELKGELVTTVGEYDEKKGVNKPNLLSGMIPVKYNSGKWIVTNKDDEEWYDYSADADKWANVMLLDGLTLVNSSTGEKLTNEEVRKANLSDIQGYVVENEGSAFVWIPRYTYKEVNGSYEIVYSKLTTDYVADGYIKNPAFYFGEYNGAIDTEPNSGYKAGGKELMGIWVSKYEAGYAE